MHITGYSTDDAEALLLIGQTTGLRVKDLLFAGILIASLGAIMDIAISIVSAIHEIYMKLPGIKKAALIRTGMNIGKDMIGTMSNTLILVFYGNIAEPDDPAVLLFGPDQPVDEYEHDRH